MQFGKLYFLPQRLKINVFWNIYEWRLEQSRRSLRNEEFFSKNINFKLACAHIIYYTIFPILAHCAMPGTFMILLVYAYKITRRKSWTWKCVDQTCSKKVKIWYFSSSRKSDWHLNKSNDINVDEINLSENTSFFLFL